MNQKHGSNILQSNGIILAGSGNVLLLMLNQVSVQLLAKFMHAIHFGFGDEHMQPTKQGSAVLYNKSTIMNIIFITVSI